MIDFLYVLSAALCVIMGGSSVYAFFARRDIGVYKRLLQATGSAASQASEPRTQVIRRVAQGVAGTASWLRSHLGLRDDGSLRDRFLRAGARSKTAGDLYLTARLAGPVFALVAGLFLPGPRFLWLTAFPAFAYLLPDLLLERAIQNRRRHIKNGIPDVVDLLVICVDAGLSLDQALQRVGQELAISHPAFGEEIFAINREQRAGRPRSEAWQSMAGRVKLEEMDAMVNMLIQTERFGTPIAKALSGFAGGIRTKRRQQAEEKAAKTTVKIIFPLVFFIFPAIFIVLLAPAALRILRGTSGPVF